MNLTNTYSLKWMALAMTLFIVITANVHAVADNESDRLDSLLYQYENDGNIKAANILYKEIYPDYSDMLIVFGTNDEKDFIDANLYTVYSNYIYDSGLYAKSCAQRSHRSHGSEKNRRRAEPGHVLLRAVLQLPVSRGVRQSDIVRRQVV